MSALSWRAIQDRSLPQSPEIHPDLPSKERKRKSLGSIKLYVNVAPLGHSASASATPLDRRRPPIGLRRDEGRGWESHQEGLGLSRGCIWSGGATRLTFLLGGKVKRGARRSLNRGSLVATAPWGMGKGMGSDLEGGRGGKRASGGAARGASRRRERHFGVAVRRKARRERS